MSEGAGEQPYRDELSLPTLMGLMATYTRIIAVTNDLGEEIAYPNGCVWADAFAFGLPKALVLAEVNRMAAWCVAHREETDEAVQHAKDEGNWA